MQFIDRAQNKNFKTRFHNEFRNICCINKTRQNKNEKKKCKTVTCRMKI